jgi:hypothetical protein
MHGAEALPMTFLGRMNAAEHLVLHAFHDAVHCAWHHPLHLHHGHVAHPLHHARRPVVHSAEGAAMDDLEGRTMMSAVPLTAAGPLLVPTVAKAATVVQIATTTAPAGPTAVADPAVSDLSFSYASFANDPLFAPGGPSANDISQGEVGDCYLLSVLSGVAKTDPGLIRQAITANANGTFTVTFAGGGKHGTPITVDSELPTMPGGRPAYAQLGTDNSLWVAVVEKAYADYANPKIDAYATIDGGWMSSAFAALGLKSTSTFSAGSATALATLLSKDLRAGDVVTLGTSASVAASSPLVGGHAYEVDSVALGSTGQITSVTLRNPWGNDVANGGYVTVTAQQAFAAFEGMAVAHA